MSIAKRCLFWFVGLILLVAVHPAFAQAPQPMYPAIQGHLWGYIDSDNQWIMPPNNLEPLQPVHDNEIVYNNDTDEWLYIQGENLTEGGHELLFPDCNLRWAAPFFEGRALIQVMLPDYSLAYAHIDPAGKIIWAEDGVDIPALQAQLDQGICPDPADMTAEEAMEMLVGEWSNTGGGEHLSEIQNADGWYTVPLTMNGSWLVRKTEPGERFYNGYGFVFVEVFTDENGNEVTYEMGLSIHHRDAFALSHGDGVSGYARYRSRYDENWQYMQMRKQSNEEKE